MFPGLKHTKEVAHHLHKGTSAVRQGKHGATPDADGRELAGAAALLLVRELDVRHPADGLPVVHLGTVDGSLKMGDGANIKGDT